MLENVPAGGTEVDLASTNPGDAIY